jgi:hypothetical protein
MACKWVRFAYRVLPLPAWRAFLLDRHIDNCAACQGAALDDAAIRSLGVTPAGLDNEPPLHPFASEVGQSRGFRPAWRYAFGFLFAVALFWVAITVYRLVPPAAPAPGIVTVMVEEPDSRGFAVLEARIGGEPARPVIFKPQQPGMTIVWFEKIKN